jgi:titin
LLDLAAALVTALLVLTAASCSGGAESEPTIVVDSIEDTDVRGSLTLREAILLTTGELAPADLEPREADNVSGEPGPSSADAVTFAASTFASPAGGTISLTSPLPPLATSFDTIDGSGSTVTVRGAGSDSQCFIITSNENGIRGLQIQHCQAAVVIRAGAHRNVIGGSAEGQGNIILSNYEGIVIEGAGADGNLIKGNLIGVDAQGTKELGNRNGIHILEQAQGNIIGGPNPGDRNVIAGSVGVGVLIRGGANIVQGNYIGTDPTGTIAIPNALEGIWIADHAQENLVGGSKKGEGNVISGNTLFGVSIAGAGANNNAVQGNYLGLDATGKATLRSTSAVSIYRGAQNNVIGGSKPGEGNVISGNRTAILLSDSETTGNVIFGNFLGMDADHKEKLPNDRGIWLSEGTHHNTIGGTGSGEGNVIAASRGEGVFVEHSQTVANPIRGNAIYSSVRAGMQIEDGASGGLQPPTISGADPLTGTTCGACTIDIFSDSDGQGRFYEGSAVADSDGRVTFDGDLRGPNVTATATDSEGNTSAFSEPFPQGDS